MSHVLVPELIKKLLKTDNYAHMLQNSTFLSGCQWTGTIHIEWKLNPIKPAQQWVQILSVECDNKQSDIIIMCLSIEFHYWLPFQRYHVDSSDIKQDWLY